VNFSAVCLDTGWTSGEGIFVFATTSILVLESTPAVLGVKLTTHLCLLPRLRECVELDLYFLYIAFMTRCLGVGTALPFFFFLLLLSLVPMLLSTGIIHEGS